MNLETVLPFGLAFLSLASFQLGGMVRNRVHVLVPWKDPFTLILTLVALSPFIIEWAGYEPPFEVTNVWYLSALVAFFLCYSIAYIKGDFGLVYIAVNTIISDEFPNGAVELKSIVWYDDPKTGRMCLQEQSFKEILKSTFLGIRSPLKFNIGSVARTSYFSMEKVFFPKIAVEGVNVSSMKVEESVVKKWIFKFKVRSYEIIPTPAYCVGSTATWMVTANRQKYQEEEITRSHAQLLEAKLTAIDATISKASDIFTQMVADKTPNGDILRDVIELIKPEEEIPIREPRPGRQVRARRRSNLEREDDDDYEEEDYDDE